MGVRPSLRGFVPQQTHFDFLPALIVANLTEQNRQLQERAAIVRMRRPSQAGPLRILEANGLGFDQIPLDLLHAPIGKNMLDGVSLTEVFREMQEDHGDVLNSRSDEEDLGQGESLEWSDQAVAELHEALLMSSLVSLATTGNTTEKVESLKWFFLPDIYCWQKRLDHHGMPVYRPIHASNIPFTFHRCCALIGLNHAVLRERLSSILQEAGLGKYLPE